MLSEDTAFLYVRLVVNEKGVMIMASVAWKKLHGLGPMSKMLMHDARYDGNDVTYRNKYIKKEQSRDNYTVGDDRYGSRFEDSPGKSDYLDLKKRLKQIDIEMPPQRVRKDNNTFDSRSSFKHC